MNESILNIIIMIGVFQGIFTSLLLVFKRGKTLSDYLLIVLILGFSEIGINVLVTSFVSLKFLCIKYPLLSFELFLPALFYLYVASVTTNKNKIVVKDLFLFVPGIIIYILLVSYYIILQNNFSRDSLLDYYLIRKTEDILIPVFWILVLYFSYVSLMNYKKWLRDNISDTSTPVYNFIKYSIILLTLGNIIFITNLFLDFTIYFCAESYIHWQIYYIVASVIVYFTGFMGYKIPAETLRPIVNNNIQDSRNSPEISTDEIEKFKSEILKVFEDKKLYINPELDLATLSSELGISPQMLSGLINKAFNTNFRNFVNNYRIEEVKKNLLSEKYSQFSIMAIALESGFNSESSFYRIFKGKTGISPSDYIKKFSQNIN